MQPSNRFPKSRRVKSPRDFSRAFKRGVVAADDTLVVLVLPQETDAARIRSQSQKAAGLASNANNSNQQNREPNPQSREPNPQSRDLPPSRLGVTIPKRTGNAVERNLWKRRIREAFRQSQAEIPPGFDFVVRPKKNAVNRWQSIEASLPRLIKRALKKLKVTS